MSQCMNKVQGGAATIYCLGRKGHKGQHSNDVFVEDEECRVEILKQVDLDESGWMRWPKTKKEKSGQR